LFPFVYLSPTGTIVKRELYTLHYSSMQITIQTLI